MESVQTNGDSTESIMESVQRNGVSTESIMESVQTNGVNTDCIKWSLVQPNGTCTESNTWSQPAHWVLLTLTEQQPNTATTRLPSGIACMSGMPRPNPALVLYEHDS